MESELVVSTIWEEDSLLELRVKGSSESFAGLVECYSNRKAILELGSVLEKFPKSVSDKFSFSTGEGDYSHFNLSGCCIDGSGHTIVTVKIAHIEHYNHSRRQHDEVLFDLKMEPMAINNFGKALLKVASEPVGKTQAVLRNAI